MAAGVTVVSVKQESRGIGELCRVSMGTEKQRSTKSVEARRRKQVLRSTFREDVRGFVPGVSSMSLHMAPSELRKPRDSAKQEAGDNLRRRQLTYCKRQPPFHATAPL